MLLRYRTVRCLDRRVALVAKFICLPQLLLFCDCCYILHTIHAQHAGLLYPGGDGFRAMPWLCVPILRDLKSADGGVILACGMFDPADFEHITDLLLVCTAIA